MKLVLADAEATTALGAALARILARRAGAVLFLHGDLGAGKTTLARGVLRALGVTGTIRSPTYTLIEPYSAAGCELLHMDLYRLQDPEELHQLGLIDYPPERTVWLVEWPERAGNLLPQPDISIVLSRSENARNVELTGLSAEEAESLLAQLA